MADKTLNDTTYGVLRHEGNELLCDSTVDDAAAFRGGAPATQRTVVKYGGDVLVNGKRIEVGQQSFKQSEHGNVTDGRFGGEWYFGLAKPSAGSNDAAMQDIARGFPVDTHPLYPEGVVVFEVPIVAPNLPGGGVFSSEAQQLWDGTGRFFAQMQNDGGGVFNFVAYEASTPFSIGSPVRALFSMNDILARLAGLENQVAALKQKVSQLEQR